MCNNNDFDIDLRNNKAKFFDWQRGAKADNIDNPRIDLWGKTLKNRSCLNESRTLSLETTNRFTVATQLEGYVIDPITGNKKDAATGK